MKDMKEGRYASLSWNVAIPGKGVTFLGLGGVVPKTRSKSMCLESTTRQVQLTSGEL